MSHYMKVLTLLAAPLPGQVGTIEPLARRCPGVSELSNVACVNKYASVIPLPFNRSPSLDGTYNLNDTFSLTNVTDPSFEIVRNASFIVFDLKRGLDILGHNPTLEFMFAVDPPDAVHEAPVYIPPPMNAIIASTLQQNVTTKVIINLNGSRPVIGEFNTYPPVVGVNGGRYFKGTVYWAVTGNDFSYNGKTIQQAPGIYALNPYTHYVTPILNNYYGQKFNGPDDLVIDSNGDIFFTDPWYGFALNFTSQPILHPGTYRFRPSTGATSIVESEIGMPNGIGLSPDGGTLYITDTAITSFTGADPNIIPRYTLSATGGKSVYAFDLINSPPGKYLVNKRPIWYPEEFADDGFHVARNGYLVGAAGLGVDVLSPYGELLVRIKTDFIVNNIQFAGPKFDELWLFGMGSISRVKWKLQGMADGRS